MAISGVEIRLQYVVFFGHLTLFLPASAFGENLFVDLALLRLVNRQQEM